MKLAKWSLNLESPNIFSVPEMEVLNQKRRLVYGFTGIPLHKPYIGEYLRRIAKVYQPLFSKLLLVAALWLAVPPQMSHQT